MRKKPVGQLSFRFENVTRRLLRRFGDSVLTTRPIMGGVYTFSYDAKWKKKLKYWDQFPLIIVVGRYPDGFLGLNLHYLPVNLRQRFLSELIKQFARASTSKRMKNINYNRVISMSVAPLVRPTVHRYLFSQMKSRLYIIPRDEWIEFGFTPNADIKFMKEPISTVHSDSVKIASGR